MSLVRMAAERDKPVVLRRLRMPGVLLRGLRHGLEYVYYRRAVSGVPSPMALDDLLALLSLVTARGLVSRQGKTSLSRLKRMRNGSKTAA
jgi:hypothetical protein